MCFLSTKMATASLLRCLGSVATDGNHSTENLTFSTLEVWWGLPGPLDGSGQQCWNSFLCVSLAEDGAKYLPTAQLSMVREVGIQGSAGAFRGLCTPYLGHEGHGAKYCLC